MLLLLLLLLFVLFCFVLFACLLLSLLLLFAFCLFFVFHSNHDFGQNGIFVAVVLFACLLLRLPLFLLLLLFWCVISFGTKFWTISTFCLSFFLFFFFSFFSQHYFLSRRTNVTLQKYSGILLLLHLPFAFCNNLYLSLYVWIKQTINI